MAHQIAFCLDKGFYYPTCIALYSLLNTTESDLDIHVFGYEFDASHWKKIHEIGDAFDTSIHQHDMNATDVILPEHSLGHISGASFMRLLLPKYLSGRVTYLDGDILVRGDISELASCDLDGKILTAAPDANISFYPYLKTYFEDHPREKARYLRNKKRNYNYYKHIEGIAKTLELTQASSPTEIYNAGIISIDFDILSNHPNLYEDYQSIEGALTRGQGRDQIYLNILFNKHVKIAPLKWNAQMRNARPVHPCIPEDERPNWIEARENPMIVHFVSKRKPWLPLSQCYSFSARKRVAEYRRVMHDFNRRFDMKS